MAADVSAVVSAITDAQFAIGAVGLASLLIAAVIVVWKLIGTILYVRNDPGEGS